jgi:hypothetical protein
MSSKETNKKQGTQSITVSFNGMWSKNEMDIDLNKGDLPIMLFFQSLNGYPIFETFDDMEDAVKRYAGLLGLGRTPQLYVRLKMKRNNGDTP